jgi:replicative DNA helicase
MSDIERKLLSRLSSAQEVTRVWEQGLRQEVFEQPVYEAMFNHIVSYWHENDMGMVPTKFVLEYEFPGYPLDDEVEESTLWLVDALKRRYATNNLQVMIEQAAVTSHEDPEGTLRSLSEDAFAATENILPRYTLTNMANNIDERRLRYAAREDNREVGVTLGLPALDHHTDGLRAGELCAIGGFSKTGKTMFLANAAVQARRQGLTPYFATLEMSKKEIEERIDAIYANISYNRFTHGELRPAEIQQWHTAQEELAQEGDLFVEMPEEGDRSVRSIVNRARRLGADYLIVDQLSFMESVKIHKDLKYKHAEVISDLKKDISRDGGLMPCLLAVQLNRASQDEGMSLRSFANATEIEQTCDLLLGLSRTRDERANRMMQLHVLGARRSDIQSWLLRWDLTDQSLIEIMQEMD